jgi:hypothetical protein
LKNFAAKISRKAAEPQSFLSLTLLTLRLDDLARLKPQYDEEKPLTFYRTHIQ